MKNLRAPRQKVNECELSKPVREEPETRSEMSLNFPSQGGDDGELLTWVCPICFPSQKQFETIHSTHFFSLFHRKSSNFSPMQIILSHKLKK